MRRSRFNDAVIACSSFAATVFLFEVALYAPGFRPGTFTYLAVDVALTLGIVLVVALAATILAGSAAPQAGVVVLAALTALQAQLGPMDVAQAVAVALVLVAVLAIDGELRRQPLALALVAAAAVCGAFRVWPRLSAVVDLPSNGVTEAALEVVVFAAGVGAALGWSAIRRLRARRLPRASVLALSTLAVVTLAVTAADAHRGARRSVLPNTALPSSRPSILVLLLDTVGANRLSIYGHPRPTTPALKRFLDSSERAVLYPLAFSTAPWTVPAHASFFAGRLVNDPYAEYDGASDRPRIREPRLSQTLRDQGYRTAAVVANPMLTRHTDLLDEFDEVVRWRPLHLLELTPGELLRAHWMPQLGVRATKPTPPAETVNRAVLDLVGRCAGGPCFVYANYMDAHQPYTPAPPYAGKWAMRRGPGRHEQGHRGEGKKHELDAALHDEAIAGLDAAIGRLLEQLAASGSLEHWWIVITADHGEAFGEHGYTRHGKGLHVEQTKVPLVIVPPRTDRLTARQDAVSLIDVATTIAALGGVDDFGAGDDLRRPASAARPAPMVFSGRGVAIPPSRGVVVGRRQLIEWADRRELYDLEADRAQQHDLAAVAPDEVERLRALLPPDVMDKGDDTAPLDEVDDAARRELRALGYLD